MRAFVRASIRGWRDYLEGDPSPANELILQRNRDMTADLLVFSRRAMIRHRFVQGDPAAGEDIGQLSPARLQDQMQTLLELKILPAPLDIDAVATTEFLPKPSASR